MTDEETFQVPNNVPFERQVVQSHKWTIFFARLGGFSPETPEDQDVPIYMTGL
jgi:hypothetical protein